MFDDLKPNNAGQNNLPNPPATPATNQAQTPAKPPEDIYAQADQSSKSAPFLPKHTIIGDKDLNQSEYPTYEQKRRLIGIGILLIGMLVIFGGGGLAYVFYFKNHLSAIVKPKVSDIQFPSPIKTTNTVSSQPNYNSTANVSPAVNTGAATTSIPPLNPNTATTEAEPNPPAANSLATSTSAQDSDQDGLTDVEEKTYGTNPLIADTDEDGLTDYQEVKVYGTDPLSVDTDADGYSDGSEVKNGYNPNGAGKLVQTGSVIK